jgi:hypothetical protein
MAKPFVKDWPRQLWRNAQAICEGMAISHLLGNGQAICEGMAKPFVKEWIVREGMAKQFAQHVSRGGSRISGTGGGGVQPLKNSSANMRFPGIWE